MDKVLQDMIKDLIEVNRQQGSTSTLLGVMYSNPVAILIVGNLSISNYLQKQHPTFKDRILTVNGIKHGDHKGLRGPLLFDTTAIISLMKEEFNVNYSATQPLDKDYQSIANPIVDALVKLKDYARSLSVDGYEPNDDCSDGYVAKHTKQINIKMTEEDSNDIHNINYDFFEGEATNSMLGRILLRKGIQFYKKLKDNF